MKKFKNFICSIVILLFYFLTSSLCIATFGTRFCFFYDWNLIDEIFACFILILSLFSQWILFMFLCKKNNIITLTRTVVYFDGIVNFFWLLLIIYFLFSEWFIDSQIQLPFRFSARWAILEIIKSVVIITIRCAFNKHITKGQG